MNWYSKHFLFSIIVAFALHSCKSGQVIFPEPSAGLVQLDTNFNTQDSASLRIILPYKTALDSQMNVSLGHCSFPMQKQRPEGLLGNWAADAVQWKSSSEGLHFTLLNHGGLRTDLPSGNITLGKIYEVMPFDNEMVILGLSKNELKKLIEIVVAKRGDPVSGIQIDQACEGPLNIRINNLAFDSISEQDTIWVTTSDYMANGGDDYGLLQNVKIRKITGILIRDAMVAYLKEYPEVTSKLEGRIKICP